MFSLVKWLHGCFNYYFGDSDKAELIAKVNSQNDLQQEVKQDLVASIMLNKTERFIQQVDQLPEPNKNDLISSIMQATKVYINSTSETQDAPDTNKVSEAPKTHTFLKRRKCHWRRR